MKSVLTFLDGGLRLGFHEWSNWKATRILQSRVRACPLDQIGRVAVYTAIFGGKDHLREVKAFAGVDFFCFTDDKDLRSKTWRIVRTEASSSDPRLDAKIYKILPHRYFPEYEFSLWVDGTHTPDIDVRYLVWKFLQTRDLALFRHPKRNCLYDEMTACLTHNKGDADQICRQREAYLKEGYPRQNGLATCTVILRRHNVDAVIRTMEDWWEQINQHSVRDQLSFNYVAHRHQLKYAMIPGDVYNNHFFRFTTHKRPDSEALRVGWILNGSPETASSRIMGDNVHEYLLAQGVASKILYRPEARITSRLNLARYEIDMMLNHNINLLVIVKLDRGPNLDYLLARCKKVGIRVVYAVCDLPSSAMLSKADAIIATSDEFRRLIPPRHHTKLHIVFDGYEHDGSRQKEHLDRRELKLCLVSNRVWDKVPCIPELPDRVSLKIIGPGPQVLKSSFPRSRVFRDSGFAFEYVVWDAATVVEEILECDAGILPWPQIGKEERIKSSNRLFLFQSLGMPVIASPVPSYLSHVRQGENGFIARTTSQWLEYLRLLRDNPERRRAIGMTARADVVDRYSKVKQGELYLSAFTEVLALSTAAGCEKAAR